MKLLDFMWLLTGRGANKDLRDLLIMDNLLPQSRFSYFKNITLHAIRKYLSMLRNQERKNRYHFVYFTFKVNGGLLLGVAFMSLGDLVFANLPVCRHKSAFAQLFRLGRGQTGM